MAVADAVVGYCVGRPARYELMVQRSVPGFAPSEDRISVTAGQIANDPGGRDFADQVGRGIRAVLTMSAAG